MAGIAALSSYLGSSSGSESERSLGEEDEERTQHLRAPRPAPRTVDTAPEVAVKEDVETGVHLDPSLKEVTYNPTYETMFAPQFQMYEG